MAFEWIPVERLRGEVRDAINASNMHVPSNVVIETNTDGRPESATFEIAKWNSENKSPGYESRKWDLTYRLVKDAMCKNGLPYMRVEYGPRYTWFRCRLADMWFTSRRPGAGIPLWDVDGGEAVSPDDLAPETDGRHHYVGSYNVSGKVLSIGPARGWGIFRYKDNRLAMMPDGEWPAHENRHSALMILGMLPNYLSRGLVYDRLSEARAMLSKIEMADDAFKDRIKYGPKKPAIPDDY